MSKFNYNYTSNESTLTNKVFISTDKINIDEISSIRFESTRSNNENQANVKVYLLIVENETESGFGLNLSEPNTDEAIYLCDINQTDIGIDEKIVYKNVSIDDIRNPLGENTTIYGLIFWKSDEYIENIDVIMDTISVEDLEMKANTTPEELQQMSTMDVGPEDIMFHTNAITQLGWFKANTQSGIKSIRVYTPESVANQRLRINTGRGIGCFNLVPPGEADTGLRVNAGNGIWGVKTYISATYEDADRSRSYPQWNYGASWGGTWSVDPCEPVSPQPRVHRVKFGMMLHNDGWTTSNMLNRTWYFYVRANGTWTQMSSIYMNQWNTYVYLDTNFGERTPTGYALKPAGSGYGNYTYSWSLETEWYWNSELIIR